MATSQLMKILNECENELGWVPNETGIDTYRARAAMHKVMSYAKDKKRVSDEDLRLALNYCKRRRMPIVSPLQLFGFVEEAKKFAAPVAPTGSLEPERNAAIGWEHGKNDTDAGVWIGRLTRAQGDGLADVLAAWREAGRGS